MSFTPPQGPPPPRVPEGWKAVFHEGYQQWYYVNLHTEQSQWEPPVSRDEAPPSYETLNERPITPGSASNAQLGSNNPFNRSAQSDDKWSSTDLGSLESSRDKDTQLDEDARFAAQLQAEEDARAREHGHRQGSQGPDSQARGENTSYYNANNPASPSLQASQSSPETSQSQSKSSRKKGGSLLHKLASKAQEKLSRPHGSGLGYPSNQHHGTSYGQPSYYASQPVIRGGFGYPLMGGGHRPYQQVHYGDPHRRRHGGGGMGMGGAAALGLGGGLLGGAMLANTMHDDHDYGDGYGDGFGDGGDFDGGGDFGGGDFGGD